MVTRVCITLFDRILHDCVSYFQLYDNISGGLDKVFLFLWRRLGPVDPVSLT